MKKLLLGLICGVSIWGGSSYAGTDPLQELRTAFQDGSRFADEGAAAVQRWSCTRFDIGTTDLEITNFVEVSFRTFGPVLIAEPKEMSDKIRFVWDDYSGYSAHISSNSMIYLRISRDEKRLIAEVICQECEGDWLPSTIGAIQKVHAYLSCDPVGEPSNS